MAGRELGLGKVVRARRARPAGWARAITGAAAVVVMIGAATACGLTPSEPTPAATSVKSSDPTKEPAVLGEVTKDPLLPAAEPLREGMLEAAGPGWSLVTYYDESAYVGTEAYPTVLYLASPEGALYEVPTPVKLLDTFEEGASASYGSPAIVDWLAGSSLVLVARSTDSPEVYDYSVVDLLTGETVSKLETPPPSNNLYAHPSFVGDGTSDLIVFWEDSGGDGPTSKVERIYRTRSDGTVIADLGGFEASQPIPVLVSPDRTRMALFGVDRSWVVDLRDLTEVASLVTPHPDAPEACTGGAWLGDDVIFLCPTPTDDGSTKNSDIWAAGLDGSLRQLASKVLADPWEALAVGGRIVLSKQPDDVWSQGPYSWSFAVSADGTLTPLPAPGVDTKGATVVAEGRVFIHIGGSAVDQGPSSLVSVDPFTGDQKVILVAVNPRTGLGVVTLPDGASGS